MIWIFCRLCRSFAADSLPLHRPEQTSAQFPERRIPFFSLFVVLTTYSLLQAYYNIAEKPKRKRGYYQMIRKIIQIDEERCNGCGLCASACHEGAIGMVNGKARLLRDDYCDGLGDCLPACPVNAISFVEREAAAYNAEEVEKNKKEKLQSNKTPVHACPGSMFRTLEHRRHRSSRKQRTNLISHRRPHPRVLCSASGRLRSSSYR